MPPHNTLAQEIEDKQGELDAHLPHHIPDPTPPRKKLDNQHPEILFQLLISPQYRCINKWLCSDLRKDCMVFGRGEECYTFQNESFPEPICEHAHQDLADRCQFYQTRGICCKILDGWILCGDPDKVRMLNEAYREFASKTQQNLLYA